MQHNQEGRPYRLFLRVCSSLEMWVKQQEWKPKAVPLTVDSDTISFQKLIMMYAIIVQSCTTVAPMP